MTDYFYDSDKKEIFIYDTLEVYKLNDIAIFIFENYIEGTPISGIIAKIVNEYEINESEAQEDVNTLIAEFKHLGIDPGSSTKNIPDEENNFAIIGKHFHLHTPIVHIIQNCNSPCKMCDCWQTKNKVWHPAEKLKLFFQKAKELGAIAIMVSGGEPLLHPELRQIILDLKELNLKIMLNTNALLLHKNLWLADLNVERLVVSMDGYDAETYQTFRGLNGYQIVWKNLELFQKHSPLTQIGIRTILNKFNFDKMDKLFDEIELRNMHSVGLSPADVNSISFSRTLINKDKEPDLISLLLPTENQIHEFLAVFTPDTAYYQRIEEAAEKGLSSWRPQEFIRCMLFYLGILKNEKNMFVNQPCFFPYTSMVLDYNGDYRNCFYSTAFGNLYKNNEADWTFKESMEKLKDSGTCQGCRGNVFCGSQVPMHKFQHVEI